MATPALTPGWRSSLRRLGAAGVAALIVAAMIVTLRGQAEPMWHALSRLDGRGVAAALVLVAVHRVVNAAGWGLVLGALGTPVRVIPAARLWLAAEACRWLPGSLWAFGSRAVLASTRGVPAATATTSVVVELAVTVSAWIVVALAAGGWSVPPGALAAGIGTLVTAAAATAAARLPTVRLLAARLAARVPLPERVARRAAALGALRFDRLDPARLAGAVVFFAAMALVNGAILLVLVRSIGAGDRGPAVGVIAANAAAWLAGFFAIFAPGGLVVREACLTGLLAAWLPMDDALAVALVWRLVQILAELATFLAVAAGGLPRGLVREESSPARVSGWGCRTA